MSPNDKTIKKISRKNWKMSYDKWRFFIILIKFHVRFHTKKGYTFLKIFGRCGYCIEIDFHCHRCHLYKEGVCCSKDYLKKEIRKGKNMAFWNILHEMRRAIRDYTVELDWEKILSDALIMKNIM